MREKINRLAKGILDRDIPELKLSPERFDDVLPPDTKRRYDLIIDTDDIFRLKGLSYCDDVRIGLETRAFMGRRCHIVFYADSFGLEPGQRTEGSIHLITNAGELEVPYCFETGHEDHAKVRDYLKELRNGEEFSEGYDPAFDEESDYITYLNEGSDGTYEAETYAEEPEESAGTDEGPLGTYDEGDAYLGEADIRDEAPEPSEASKEYLSFLSSCFPQDDELLSELCGLLIGADETGSFAFSAYREAIARDIKLTRLYEYYIYSYPEGSSEQMPKSVLLYFSYDNMLEPRRKACLYKDILLYEAPDSELYASYEPQIRDYAMASVFARRIDDKLSLIYDRMLYPDMIDRKAAEVLPDILKCRRISTKDSRAAFVLLRYPELIYEDRYPIRNGAAYIPIYFDSTKICFLDKRGREIRPEGGYEEDIMLRRPDLLRRCFEIYPDHPMLKLAAAKKVLSAGASTETEAEILKDALRSLKLSREFSEAVIKELLKRDGGSADIRGLAVEDYGPELSKLLFSSLLRDGYHEDAYLCLRRMGEPWEVGKEELHSLVMELIAKGSIPVIKGETDQVFVIYCKYLFDMGFRDKELLSFLTREYEGATEDMYAILSEADKAGARLYELPEKVLSSKLFSGMKEHLDECFEIYLRTAEKQKENMVCAYLTVRCSDYFEGEKEEPIQGFFEILYSYVSSSEDYEKLPDIYLLALTKHYQEKEKLLDEETELCQKLTDILISRGLIFRYTKALKKKISIPKEICERYYIEYHGSREAPPRLYIRISPEDKDFRSVEMTRVYGGIYVTGIVLFVEDELHYMIYDESISDTTVQEGSISVKKLHSREDDRYSMLDRMTKELKEDKLKELSEDLKEYMLKDRLRRGLFDIR